MVRRREEGGKETRDAHVVRADEEETVNREFASMIVVQAALLSVTLMV